MCSLFLCARVSAFLYLLAQQKPHTQKKIIPERQHNPDVRPPCRTHPSPTVSHSTSCSPDRMIDGSHTPDARLTAAGVRRLMETGQGLQTKVKGRACVRSESIGVKVFKHISGEGALMPPTPMGLANRGYYYYVSLHYYCHNNFCKVPGTILLLLHNQPTFNLVESDHVRGLFLQLLW